MEVVEIFELLAETAGKNAKVQILKDHESELLKKIFSFTYDDLKQYYVTTHTVKKIERNYIPRGNGEERNWIGFLDLLKQCNEHEISGNDAVEKIHTYFERMPVIYEKWMRRVLDRHLNVGITSKSINKAYKKDKKDPNLIYAFEVQLADKWPKFEKKIIATHKLVAVEPKLDGFRCIAMIQGGKCSLMSRNGKSITKNFVDTVCKELESLNLDDCILDGELMGRTFKETTQQVHKKTNPDVTHIKFHVFDYLSFEDWKNQETKVTCEKARESIEDMCLEARTDFIKTVSRLIVSPLEVQKYHDIFVQDNYEGVMIKTLDTKYKFGRGSNVLKHKAFFDTDVLCIAFEEGTGKHQGVLGAIIVNYNDVLVNVGSGFSDKQREEIWNNQQNYRMKMCEVRYQEETEDGSLRFPTFRTWRPDKD